MTVNIAFKTPDALVFATDGLATVMDVDEHGQEKFLSNMENVEKLILLSDRDPGLSPVLAMFNGVGSLGAGTVATDLRAIDRLRPRQEGSTVRSYLDRVSVELERTTRKRLGSLPRPFHLIVAGFDPTPEGDVVPSIQSLQWPSDVGRPPERRAALEVTTVDGLTTHQYGAYYAGLTEAVARFVEGFDPRLPERLGILLAGMGQQAPPGLLEQMVQDAARLGGGKSVSNAEAHDLANRYAYLIVRAAFDNPELGELSQHFSLQSAIDYCVFLAQCAYARESLSPSRKGPPRVGSTLQVAYLAPARAPVMLSGIRLGIRVHGYAAFATNGG